MRYLGRIRIRLEGMKGKSKARVKQSEIGDKMLDGQVVEYKDNKILEK